MDQRSSGQSSRFSIATIKTTGHISVSPWRRKAARYWAPALLFAALLLGVAAAPASAFDLHLTIANDPIVGGAAGDDLYTAGLAVEVQRGFGHFSFGERMFTDREAGQRFDETYLAAHQRLAAWGSWQPTVGFGVLHIGEGLLGQPVQNRIHEAIGSDLLDLDYISRSRYFGELFARLERSDLLGHGRLVKTAVELRAAPGFRSWLRAMTTYEAPFGRHFSWRAGLGVHAEEAELPLLERHVESLAPAGELGIAWRSLTLLWSYNELGTATSHLTLGMKVPLQHLARGAATAIRR